MIAIILGTRPELIKLAPVIQKLKDQNAKTQKVDFQVISTGQNREALVPFFGLFEFQPDVDLGFKGTSDLTSNLAQLVSVIDAQFKKSRPSAVMVQGDTATAFAGSLAAFYHKIPVLHVEAGLRTRDPMNPFPEESQRQMISRLAHVHFCPTEANRQNLLQEGVSSKNILVSGNTVLDTLDFVRRRHLPFDFQYSDLKTHSPELHKAIDIFGQKKATLLAMFTTHRPENQGAHMKPFFKELRRFVQDHSEVHWICPYHVNPKVKSELETAFGGLDNFHLIPPLTYPAMVFLQKKSHFCLTDSAGLQEEYPTFGKPLLILRKNTERPEIEDCGLAKTVGTESLSVVRTLEDIVQKMTKNKFPGWFNPEAVNPFGSGQAAEKIVNYLVKPASDWKKAA